MKVAADQVQALAPDTSSLAAAKKLAQMRHWKSLGRSERALWGECQGSAPYQTRVDATDWASQCSCPSRKLPCKHALGLLLLAAADDNAIPESAPPEWVTSWLARRTQVATAREAKKAARSDKPVDAEAQAARIARRIARVRAGLDHLDRWMADLVRTGLAGLERDAARTTEDMARRMVDAQAPGLASRVRRLGYLAGASTDWPELVLGELGKLAVLGHAFRRIDRLEPALANDVRQLIGFSVREDDVLTHGDVVTDEWIVLGQIETDDERVRAQRSYLQGKASKRRATVLQFSPGLGPFPESIVAGTTLSAELAFWPSAYPQRALIRERKGTTTALDTPWDGPRTVGQLFDELSRAVARQPFLDRMAATLCGVVPVRRNGRALVVDAEGAALPLTCADPLRLLAVSGGAPIDVAGELDRRRLRLVGAFAEGRYHAFCDGL